MTQTVDYLTDLYDRIGAGLGTLSSPAHPVVHAFQLSNASDFPYWRVRIANRGTDALNTPSDHVDHVRNVIIRYVQTHYNSQGVDTTPDAVYTMLGALLDKIEAQNGFGLLVDGTTYTTEPNYVTGQPYVVSDTGYAGFQDRIQSTGSPQLGFEVTLAVPIRRF